MKDRVPQYPGRVQLVPVEGQSNIYDMTRADGALEEGTPLNKANLLSDETAAKLELSENEATPDKAFNALSTKAIRLNGTATLPSSGWVDNTASSGYYYKDVVCAEILVSDAPTVAIAKSFTNAVSEKSMQEAWDTLQGAKAIVGGIRFFSDQIPSNSVTFQWEVIR